MTQSTSIAALLCLISVSVSGAQVAPMPLTVPFEYDGHIFVRAAVNGVPARLVYDPISGVILDRDFVRREGLDHASWRDLGMGGPTWAGGAGSVEHEVTWSRNAVLLLDTLRMDLPRPPVLPLDSMMSGSFHLRPDGLLGSGFLGRWSTAFDFDRGVMTLGEAGAPVAADRGTVLSLEMRNNRPVVQGRMRLPDGTWHRLDLLVDFGMAGGVRLTTALVDSLDLVHRLQTTALEHAEAGLGGALESRAGVLPTLELGGLALHDVRVTLARERTGADAHPPWNGLIGLALLARYNLVYDPTAARLILLPRREAAAP